MSKNPWEWTTVDDIQELIDNQVKESISLDYKQSGALQKNEESKKGISKHVSAFANSAGGTLIYGVKEDKCYPTDIDNGSDPKVITKEWLEDVISGTIERRIPNILINQIPLPNGNVIYVVYIPQSTLAPHMANIEKKYFKRYNFKSEPMEEYEVRDVMNRHTSANLKLNIKLDCQDPLFPELGSFSNPVSVQILMSNDSIIPAEYTSIRMFFDSRLNLPSGFSSFTEKPETQLPLEGQTVTMKTFDRYLCAPRDVPLLKGICFPFFGGIGQMIKVPKQTGSFYIVVNLHTARAEPKRIVFILSHDGKSLTVMEFTEIL
ncbi:ATP-binding protein [Neobacillus sp. YIM B06451]|uniref:AlbA family DNA-binding domain-containing protein n=1 Tax=Neobacillus sp. YIM B06451 TaxID=3070994 RepID=UPI0029309B75|nr:ATP-binding protein [Neobacillus sp. YIM B06451]